MPESTSPWSLEGRHALVCGASQGIGAASARALARAGARVSLLARREAALQQVARSLPHPERARVLVADLDDREELIARLSAVLDADPVHILINNTGGPPGGALLAATSEAIEHALGRHLLAAHRLTQLLLPGMRSSGYGRIINILSTSVREPIDNLGVSNLTRAAVASWAKSLSRELPPGITINNVLPGFTATPRLSSLAEARAQRQGVQPEQIREAWRAVVPEARIAQPFELAAAVAFLASPAASYIRGVSLPVDGGRLRSI